MRPVKPVLLYIRGDPGSGKSTTAREITRELGWPLVWFHDFDFLRPVVGPGAERVIGDAVYATLRGLMIDRQNILYVRPSRSVETVNRIRHLAEYHDYRFLLVGLTASYDTLCARVAQRPKSEYRISTRDGLDEYLSRPEFYEFDGQHVIDTTMGTPQETARKIVSEVVR